MSNQLQALDDGELVTVTGGDLRGATFGAFAALNALSGDPSNSVAKAMQGRPGILRIAPGAGQGGGNWPFSSYGGSATARFGY
jgi:hypothetical protein